MIGLKIYAFVMLVHSW